jgi:energy-coupling factor transport system permease protein
MRAPAYFVPRFLHPGAWWLWALGLATAASRTTNPILLLLLITVASLVVMARRPNAPWALSFRLYVYLAIFVVVIRAVFRILFNGNGPTVLFTLPQVRLPEIMAGVQLLGPVSAESVLSGFYDGLRLATMIICVGAANALANPKRLLAAVPGALYEIGTVLVVSLSVFPQLAESVQRVHRAKALRSGPGKGRSWIRGVLIPVLADALDRSLVLAAAMDSRGYGRHGTTPVRKRHATSALLVVGMLGLMVGLYGVMDGSTPRYLGGPTLLAGALVAALALRLAGRRVKRTRYRPDRWRMAEFVVIACGVVCATGLYFTSSFDPTAVYPSLYPLTFPTVTAIPLLAIVFAALPAVATPAPPDPNATIVLPSGEHNRPSATAVRAA